MSLFREIKNAFAFFSNKNETSRRLVFYSEKSIYFLYYRDFLEKLLENSEISFSYISSDKSDPIYQLKNHRIKTFYFNKLLPLLFPFINSRILVMTLPGLNQAYIRKKADSRTEYIYIFHAMMSTHMAYEKGAFDHFDTIFCVGQYQITEIRKTEKLYSLNEKNLLPIGYPLLERLHKQYSDSASKLHSNEPQKVLIAPSWFDGNIFESCASELIDKLILSGYQITIRPHPEFIKRKLPVILQLKEKYKNTPLVIFEENLVNNESVVLSEILITDWSGIAFEYAWAVERPVIFIDTVKKINNPEYAKIDIEPLECSVRHKIGRVLKINEIYQIDTAISALLESGEEAHIDLRKEREKHVSNWLCSADVGANYILKALSK